MIGGVVLDAYSDMKKGERGAWISIISYLILSTFKLISGVIFGSSALTADGLNNLTDIIASVAVLVGLRISQKPPDQDHPYGHLRAETVAALLASFIMATVGIQLFIETIRNWVAGGGSQVPDMSSAWVALISAVFMYLVYRYNRKLAIQINNQALMAAAKDTRSDVFVSIGAAIGIIGAQFGLPWLDRVAALFVAALICKTAWDIFTDATLVLTDGFDEKQLLNFRTSVARIPGVETIKDMKARVHGNKVLVDVVVQVNPGLNIAEGHRISDEIERRMMKKHNIMNVHVHMEPYEHHGE